MCSLHKVWFFEQVSDVLLLNGPNGHLQIENEQLYCETLSIYEHTRPEHTRNQYNG